LIGKIPEGEFEKIEIPYHLTLWTYLVGANDLEKKVDFFTSFLAFAGKYGNGLLKIYEQLKKLKNGFDEFHSQFQKDDFKSVVSYLKSKTNDKGHIYEEDFFTELIRLLLDKLKESDKEEKKTVLIIDDLDRLDPDHIFRLLNIFSAHIDFAGVDNNNKFDFDKVLLVCDYSNIKNVFVHRYGPSAEFNGYIDKFYSSVYWFDSSSHINKIIGKYLNEIDVGVGYDFFTQDHCIGGHIRYIIHSLIKFNLLNFREILGYDKAYNLKSGRDLIIEKSSLDSSLLQRFDFNSIPIIHFLLDFFNNDSSLLDKVDRAGEREIKKEYERHDEDARQKISELLLLINHSKFTHEDFNRAEDKIIHIPYLDYIFRCRVNEKNGQIVLDCTSITQGESEVTTEHINYFVILGKAIRVFKDLVR